jgi:hypothetical protein
VTYSLGATKNASEIISALKQVFASDYRIYSISPGLVRLTAVTQVEIELTINGASLSILDLIQSKLSSSSGLQSVTLHSFSGGVAKLALKTHAPAREIGVFLETMLPNQAVVTGVTASTIDLMVK